MGSTGVKLTVPQVRLNLKGIGRILEEKQTAFHIHYQVAQSPTQSSLVKERIIDILFNIEQLKDINGELIEHIALIYVVQQRQTLSEIEDPLHPSIESQVFLPSPPVLAPNKVNGLDHGCKAQL